MTREDRGRPRCRTHRSVTEREVGIRKWTSEWTRRDRQLLHVGDEHRAQRRPAGRSLNASESPGYLAIIWRDH
jgi:hypothetical protein